MVTLPGSGGLEAAWSTSYPRAAIDRARAPMRSYPASVSCWYRRDDDDQGDCGWRRIQGPLSKEVIYCHVVSCTPRCRVASGKQVQQRNDGISVCLVEKRKTLGTHLLDIIYGLALQTWKRHKEDKRPPATFIYPPIIIIHRYLTYIGTCSPVLDMRAARQVSKQCSSCVSLSKRKPNKLPRCIGVL